MKPSAITLAVLCVWQLACGPAGAAAASVGGDGYATCNTGSSRLRVANLEHLPQQCKPGHQPVPAAVLECFASSKVVVRKCRILVLPGKPSSKSGLDCHVMRAQGQLLGASNATLTAVLEAQKLPGMLSQQPLPKLLQGLNATALQQQLRAGLQMLFAEVRVTRIPQNGTAAPTNSSSGGAKNAKPAAAAAAAGSGASDATAASGKIVGEADASHNATAATTAAGASKGNATVAAATAGEAASNATAAAAEGPRRPRRRGGKRKGRGGRQHRTGAPAAAGSAASGDGGREQQHQEEQQQGRSQQQSGQQPATNTSVAAGDSGKKVDSKTVDSKTMDSNSTAGTSPAAATPKGLHRLLLQQQQQKQQQQGQGALLYRKDSSIVLQPSVGCQFQFLVARNPSLLQPSPSAGAAAAAGGMLGRGGSSEGSKGGSSSSWWVSAGALFAGVSVVLAGAICYMSASLWSQYRSYQALPSEPQPDPSFGQQPPAQQQVSPAGREMAVMPAGRAPEGNGGLPAGSLEMQRMHQKDPPQQQRTREDKGAPAADQGS